MIQAHNFDIFFCQLYQTILNGLMHAFMIVHSCEELHLNKKQYSLLRQDKSKIDEVYRMIPFQGRIANHLKLDIKDTSIS